MRIRLEHSNRRSPRRVNSPNDLERRARRTNDVAGQSKHATESGIARQRPSGIMFWGLVLMASVVFAPCVLVPVWRDYQAIKLAERLEAGQIERMRERVSQLERKRDGLLNDPGVIARLAMRNLAYRRPGETVVPVTMESGDPHGIIAEMESANTVSPVEPPMPIARFLAATGLENKLDAFSQSNTRIALMALSAALVLAAFALFPSRPIPRRASFENVTG